MYSARGRSNAYGQQQPSYPSHNLGGTSSMPNEDSELSAHRNQIYGHVPGHHSASVSQPAHYSGLYGSQQMSPMRSKGPLTVSLEGQSSYIPSMPDSPKFVPKEYIPSSTRDYGQKVDQLYPDMMSEYPSVERRQYAERQSSYFGKDLPSETSSRFPDSMTYGRQHQSTLYDHTELTPIIRQEPLLKAHTLLPASVEGGPRYGRPDPYWKYFRC